MFEKVSLWGLRVATFCLPFSVGLGLSDWLESNIKHDLPVIVFAWCVWALFLLATAFPHVIGQTIARVSVVAVVASTLLIPPGRHNPLIVAHVLLTALLVFSRPVCAWWINGTAYPNERRYPLRTPLLLVAGPIEVAYAITIGIPITALLLLCNSHWLAGIAVGVLGIVPVLLCVRAIHQLGRRWIVFVPAGLVIHDPMSLIDPVLFERAVIEKFAPAPADTDALDLTQSAYGLSIELDLHEKVPMVLSLGRGKTESGSSARLMITPAQPGAVLAEASKRKIPH